MGTSLTTRPPGQLQTRVLAECPPILILLLPHNSLFLGDLSLYNVAVTYPAPLWACATDHLNLSESSVSHHLLLLLQILIFFRCHLRKATSYSYPEPPTRSSYYSSALSATVTCIVSQLTIPWYLTTASRTSTATKHLTAEWSDSPQPTAKAPQSAPPPPIMKSILDATNPFLQRL